MRIFITGISGYLGGLLLKALDAEDSVEKVIGVDVREPSFKPAKLEFHNGDVRDPGLVKYMRGADVVLHMAFILDEIKDKKLTDDININGSRNVFDCAVRAGVPWIVFLSSMAAYAGFPDNPLPMDDDYYPRGHRGIYYTYAKAEMEHYLRYLREVNPGLEVTVLRPCIIAGPNLKNTVLELFSQPFAAKPRGHNPETQLITEEALVNAIMLVLLEARGGQLQHHLGRLHDLKRDDEAEPYRGAADTLRLHGAHDGRRLPAGRLPHFFALDTHAPVPPGGEQREDQARTGLGTREVHAGYISRDLLQALGLRACVYACACVWRVCVEGVEVGDRHLVEG